MGDGAPPVPGAGTVPRWPRTAEEFARFADVQQALGRFMADTPWDQELALRLRGGGTLTGQLHGIHTRTSATYPIHHAATVLLVRENGVAEVDFLDIEEVG